MTAVSDSAIFGNILSTPESAKIWSDETRTSYYLQFEASLAKVQARLGTIPSKAADAITRACTLDIIDWAELRKQTEIIGYPVLPVVKQLVARVNAEEAGLGEWSHWGATTQDVTDTATVMQLRDTLAVLDRRLEAICNSLRALCQKHKTTPMPARSNLQQAVPISFGFKLARLLATFQRHTQRMKELRSRLLVLEFGGAAGLECQDLLAAELGLSTPDIAWHTERDRIAEAGCFFALLTGTCAKFAFDVKLMMQTEVGEVSEPYVKNRGSSSTMPQKRNPISSAYISAAASTVRTLSGSLLEAMVEDHERSTGPWEIEWIVLPQICTLTDACLRHTADLLEGLEVHEDRMSKNLALSKGTIVSEAVMMSLGPTLGRQYAHDLVYDLCRKSSTSGQSLVDLLDEAEEVKLSRAELENLCDPSQYLGYSEKMTEKILRASENG